MASHEAVCVTMVVLFELSLKRRRKKPPGTIYREAPARNCKRATRGCAGITQFSNLVFGRPSGLWPFFHWPRSFRSLTRSKRLRTERLPPTVPVAFRVECLDMIVIDSKIGSRIRHGTRHCGALLLTYFLPFGKTYFCPRSDFTVFSLLRRRGKNAAALVLSGKACIMHAT